MVGSARVFDPIGDLAILEKTFTLSPPDSRYLRLATCSRRLVDLSFALASIDLGCLPK